jgi:hypothetical protein
MASSCSFEYPSCCEGQGIDLNLCSSVAGILSNYTIWLAYGNVSQLTDLILIFKHELMITEGYKSMYIYGLEYSSVINE